MACESDEGLAPAVVAGILVALVFLCSSVAAFVAYRIGFHLAVKRLRAFKALQKFQETQPKGAPLANRPRVNMETRRRSMDIESATMHGSAEVGGRGVSPSRMTESGALLSQSQELSGDRPTTAGMLNSIVMGLGGARSKRKRNQMELERQRIADGRLKEVMQVGQVEEIKAGINVAAGEGASEALLSAAGILYDRLVASFLGFDIKPQHLPYHVKQDLPLAQKMGTTLHLQTGAGMPGYVPGPESPDLVSGATSHEEVKLRGFIKQANQDMAAETEVELQRLPAKEKSEYEDVAWLAVPKAGGGVRFFNYASRKTSDTHEGQVSRDFHFKPEARLRVAEDAIVHLVEENAELRSKSEAQATQISLLRDDVKTNTRDRWFSNHRTRWYSDPSTTLQIDWSQLAGSTAKGVTELVNEHTAELSGTARIDSLPDALRLAQKVVDKLHSGLGLAAYVAYTGLLQSERLTVAVSAGSNLHIAGKPLPPTKCPLTYLAKSGREVVHIPDVKADKQVFYWRGYAIGSGSFVAVPITLPGSMRVAAVLCVDTLQRPAVKSVTSVELEALEVVANCLGKVLAAAEGRERASIVSSLRLAADAATRRAVTRGERATKGIVMSCTMQSVEQQLRSQDMSNQLEASVMELADSDAPTADVVAVCAALLAVIDYDVVIQEMEAREWSLPSDRSELLTLWHQVVLRGMSEISENLLMVFDHLRPHDINSTNCLRFERAAALLTGVRTSAVEGAPVLVQLLYQWLTAAQEANGLAVAGAEAELKAVQSKQPPPDGTLRPGQVTVNNLCDIITKRFR